MLSQLYIENIAVIKKASVAFDSGLNVLTGETGAGKTILLGAIQAVLGERTSRDLIRTGEKKATVSALFTQLTPRAQSVLGALGFGPDEDGQLLIQREISASGNLCRINGMPATVTNLRQIGSQLLAIHGQFDTQALADIESHRLFIDSFGMLETDKEAYTKHYAQLLALRDKLSQRQMSEVQKLQRLEFLEFQINDIASHNLVVGEEEALIARRDVIRNAEHISTGLRSAAALLMGEESVGAADAVFEASEALARITQYLPGGESMVERLHSAGYELRDVGETLQDLMRQVEFDPDELDAIEGRLNAIQKLELKYGGDIAAILKQLEAMSAERDSILFADEHIKKLEQAYAQCEAEATQTAAILSAKRREAGERFTTAVERELADLDMPSVKLGVQITPKELGPTGADTVEILFTANRGEELRPLSKIASGGEMSRVMLAIKNVMSGRDDIDTLIFDEIDAGVSGRAAHKIGEKLSEVARERQILCVTHLAQVAAFADHHLLIEKQEDAEATFTDVVALDTEGRAQELARITSGEQITEATLQNAREMLEQARRRHA